MGGPSAEHDVSLHTGKQVLGALNRKKYAVRSYRIPKTAIAKSINISKFKNFTDIVFIALHGEYGEDGRIQALLDVAQMPYTGSGVLASALAMDKMKSAEIFRAHRLVVPKQVAFCKREWQKEAAKIMQRIRKLGLPVVIKPVDRGSSVGVSIVKDFEDLKISIKNAFKYSERAMAEEFIRGRELTCGVLEDPKSGEPFALLPIEIVPRAGAFYDYTSKYADGGSDHLIPPPGMPRSLVRHVQKDAVSAHKALGCRGMSRSDFIVRRGAPYILEVNTIPGMTGTSLLPQAAHEAGIYFPKLLDQIIKSSLRE